LDKTGGEDPDGAYSLYSVVTPVPQPSWAEIVRLNVDLDHSTVGFQVGHLVSESSSARGGMDCQSGFPGKRGQDEGRSPGGTLASLLVRAIERF